MMPTPHAEIVVDNQGIISQINRFAVQSSGLSKEELIHQNIHQYFHPKNISVQSCELCKHIHREESFLTSLTTNQSDDYL